MQNLSGVYKWMAGVIDTHSVWQVLIAYIVLEFFLIEIGYEIREFTEGFPYNLSRASKYGDRALIVCLLLGISILQQPGLALPGWANTIWHQAASAALALLIGLVWHLYDLDNRGTSTVTDACHNLIVAPVFIFMVLMMAPVFYASGRRDILTAVLLLVFWAGMTGWDAKLDRLDQPRWFAKHFPGILKKHQ